MINSFLKNKRIILGVTGSIAAYKSPLLVREIIKRGGEVVCVMTPSARNFVTKLVLENLSRNPVILEMFDPSEQSRGAWHILEAHKADAMLIAPCTATTLSRLATGLCDTALTTLAVALPSDTPLLVAPAMDETMYFHPTTQRNIRIIEQDGAIIIPPTEGELASGLSGKGRLPDINVVLEYLEEALK